MTFDAAAARRVGERWGAGDSQIGAAAAGVLLLQACDEIERLRLTDAERRVIESILIDPDFAPAYSAATLRGLLKRVTL
jgi:hypothetical protein